jgi:hypothetical protein
VRIVVLSVALLGLVAAIESRASQAGPPAAPPRNLQVLRDLPPGQLDDIMRSMNRALGVECTHCHVPDAWHLETKAPFGVARRMLQMVSALNEGLLKETAGVACWTCHAGQVQPSRIQPESWEAEVAKWPEALASASQGMKITMAVYTASLGVTCEFCHVTTDWTAATKPAHRMVATMNAMFKEFPKYMPQGARTQCYMCHKGSTSPLRQPPG